MSPAPVKILLAEDSASDVELLEEALRQTGPEPFEFTRVERLEEALDWLRREDFDVLLLDLSLPDSTGPDTFVRARAAAHQMPIVVLTGAGDESVGLEAIRHGIQDYLVKGQTDGRQIARAIRYAIERKRAREALQRAKDELEQRVAARTAELRATSRYARSLIEASLDPLVTISPEGKITDVNIATELVTGISRDRLIGTDFSEYFTEPQEAEAGYQKVLAEGLVRDYPLTIRHVSGRTIDVLYHATVYRDNDGRVQGVFAAARDITERQRLQAVLEQERLKLKGILDATDDGVCIVNQRHEVEYVNPVMEREFGLVNGRKCYEYLEGGTEPCPWCRNQEVFTGKSFHREWTFSRTNRTYDVFSTPTRGPSGRIAKLEFFHDITERKQMAEAFQQSEESLAEAQRIAHIGNWNWDVRTNRLTWSDETYRIFGATPQQFGATYDVFLSYVHPDDREYVDGAVKEALRNGRPYSIDHRIVLEHGAVRHVHEDGEVHFDKKGSPLRMVGTVQDVTDRKHLEEELLDASNREQHRIGQDLHDGLCQRLASIELKCRVMEKELDARSRRTVRRIREIGRQIRGAIAQTRSLVRGLSPVKLETQGLMSALQELADNIRPMFGVQCRFECEEPVLIGDGTVSIHLYRIAQEAINNAIKHGKAGKIVISLEKEDGHIQLRVSHDGIPLAEDLKHSKGMGLRIMHYRAGMIGATLEICRVKRGRFTACVICTLQKRLDPAPPPGGRGDGTVCQLSVRRPTGVDLHG